VRWITFVRNHAKADPSGLLPPAEGAVAPDAQRGSLLVGDGQPRPGERRTTQER